MGVDVGGALLQVFGGAVEEGGTAVKENAVMKMKEEALMLREQRLANLQDRNAERTSERNFINQSALNEETRAHEVGLLDREADRADKLHDRSRKEGLEDQEALEKRKEELRLKIAKENSPEAKAKLQIDALIMLGMTEDDAKNLVKSTFSNKGDTALKRVEAFGKIKASMIKAIAGDMEPTPAHMELAHNKTIEIFKIMGYALPKTKADPTSLAERLARLPGGSIGGSGTPQDAYSGEDDDDIVVAKESGNYKTHVKEFLSDIRTTSKRYKEKASKNDGLIEPDVDTNTALAKMIKKVQTDYSRSSTQPKESPGLLDTATASPIPEKKEELTEKPVTLREPEHVDNKWEAVIEGIPVGQNFSGNLTVQDKKGKWRTATPKEVKAIVGWIQKFPELSKNIPLESRGTKKVDSSSNFRPQDPNYQKIKG